MGLQTSRFMNEMLWRNSEFVSRKQLRCLAFVETVIELVESQPVRQQVLDQEFKCTFKSSYLPPRLGINLFCSLSGYSEINDYF